MRGVDKFAIALTLLSFVPAPGCATKQESLREKQQRQVLERWLRWAEVDKKEMIQREDDARASLERSAQEQEAEQAVETVAEEPEDEPQP